MTEEWRSVLGYEGLYEVSSLGRVRSLDRTVTRRDGKSSRRRGVTLRKGVTKAGYELVALTRDGVSKSSNVHVIVANAFLENPENNPLVRHLDDIGTHNEVENLAWGTYSQNRKDAVNSGAYINQYANATHCIRGHEFDTENTYLIPSGGRTCRKCRTDYQRSKNE